MHIFQIKHINMFEIIKLFIYNMNIERRIIIILYLLTFDYYLAMLF